MKTLVESCFVLDTKTIKNDLRLARRQKGAIGGCINIIHGNKQSVADYYIEIGKEHDYLVIQYGEEEQRIRLTEGELHFGPRSMFICDCGTRVGKLYLPSHAIQFKCRKCHNLAYQSTTINRTSKHGKFLHQQSQILKLADMRDKMNRIFYKSRYTKRFLHWLGLCSRAGLFDEAMQAWKLQDAVNGYKQ